MTATTYHVHATRSGPWWALSVPEAPGVYTQVKRLDQAPEMARDALALFFDVDPGTVDVEVAPVLDDAGAAFLAELERRRLEATTAARNLDASAKAAAWALTQDGMSVRDAAVVLGLSFQRVHQLAHGDAPSCPVCGAPGTWAAAEISIDAGSGGTQAVEALTASLRLPA